MSDAIPRSIAERIGPLPLVTMIAAPAGCGKTMLAAELAADAGARLVTLRLEPPMAAPEELLPALAALFRADLGEGVPPLASEDLIFAEAWLRRLLQAALRVHRPFALLLDDAHRLAPGAPSAPLLAAALRDAPEGLHLLLTGRRQHEPCWLRFLAEGRGARVAPEDLALDAAECAGLIAARGGAAAGWSPEALLAASGRWMLGARMLLERGAPGGATASVPEAQDTELAMAGLIEAELLAPLPADWRHDLERLEPFSGLPVPVLCAALDGLTEARLLGYCRTVPFLRLDEAGRLRVHDLLRLAIRQHSARPTDAAALRRAADALVAGGDPGTAVALLAGAGRWQDLTEVVAAAAPVMAEAGDYGVLLSVLERMPEAFRQGALPAAYWHGVSLLNINPVRARGLLWAALERAEAAAARGEPEARLLLVPLWVACVDSVWLEWVDCTSFDPLLERLPALGRVAAELGQEALLVRGAFGALSFRDPAHEGFPAAEARNFSAFLAPAPRHETIRRGIQLLFRYCWGEGARWKADQVRSRLSYLFRDETAPLADICTHLVVTTEYLSLFATRNEEVYAALEQGLEVTARHQQGFWDITMINAALYRAMCAEDTARGAAWTDLLAERLGPGSNPNHVAIHEHFRAYLLWLEGADAAALEHALAAWRLAAASGFPITPVYYGLSVAAILPGLGRRAEALAWAGRARREARAQGSHVLCLIAGLRCAALALAAGARGRALGFLRNALAAGAGQRLMVHPWLRRAEMSALLDLARQEGIEPAYVDELTGALDLSQGVGARLEITTLGQFDIRRGGVSRLPPGKAPRVVMRMLLHLVAAGPQGLTAEALSDRLWPEAEADAARKRLKTTLYRLRALLGDVRGIRVAAGRIALNREAVQVDAWEIERLARAATATGAAGVFAAVAALRSGTFAGAAAFDDEDLLVYGRHLDRLFEELAVRDAEDCARRGDRAGVLDIVRELEHRLGPVPRLEAVAAGAADRAMPDRRTGGGPRR